jgi:hypothetical protein
MSDPLKDKLLAYWETARDNLSDLDSYKDWLKTRQNCATTALDIGRLLLEDGREPYILQFRGTPFKRHAPSPLYLRILSEIDGYDEPPIRTSLVPRYNRHVLIPRPYGGEIRWQQHSVCAADEVVYDPTLDQPTPEDVYPEALFIPDTAVEVKRIGFEEFAAGLGHSE